MPGIEHEEYLPEARRRKMEVIHSLVPNGDLGTRHIARDGPVVRLALDQHRRLITSEVEPVHLGCRRVTNGDRERALKVQTLVGGEIGLGECLEFSAGVSIRDGANPLVVRHRGLTLLVTGPRKEAKPTGAGPVDQRVSRHLR